MKKIKNIRILIIFVVLVFASFLVITINSHKEQNEYFLKQMLVNEAKSNFHNIVNTRKWNASHGGVYVKQKEGLKPNKYLEDNTLLTKDGETLIKINPAWMTRQISEISNKEQKNFYKITSLNPLNPINYPDKFEKEALEFFEKNKSTRFYTKISDNLSEFNFMGSLKVTSSCLQCHKHQGYKIGDIRGGIRVSIPTKKYYTSYNEVEKKSNLVLFVTLLTTMILIFLFIKLFNKLIKSELEIIKNFTDIKKLKAEKEKLVIRYEQAIEGSRDGLWDWNLNTNQVYFSKNWKGMLGFNEDEIENHLKEWEKRVHPDDKEQAIKDIKDNQNKKTSHYQNIHRMKHKNGSWVWILDRGKTYYDEDGKPSRMVGFHSNITELKNLEMDLKNARSELLEFKFIIENAPVSILTTDINGSITYANPQFCKVSGHYESEILGKNPNFLRYDRNKSEDDKFKQMWERISDKKTWGGIFKNRKKNGDIFWVTATILPIINNKGETRNYLAIMREITKEVYLEKELKEKEQMMLVQSKNAAMGEMISMIAHQWRQPITTISMIANNIIADIELDEFNENTIKESAKNIGKQTQYLSKTIDDFRNFFKEDKELKEFSISELIDELNSILLASIKNNNIEYIINYKEDYVLETLERELLQVLLNIVKNAKEALVENRQENRILEITITQNDQNINFDVKDNAGGIKEKNLDNVFEAYFTTKNEINGTGLGLYMSKMIVEKHLKGTISVTNEKEGALFSVSIQKVLLKL